MKNNCENFVYTNLKENNQKCILKLLMESKENIILSNKAKFQLNTINQQRIEPQVRETKINKICYSVLQPNRQIQWF